MTTYYSDHFSAKVGDTGHCTTRLSPRFLSPGGNLVEGFRHGRHRTSVAYITVPNATTLASADVIRVMDLRSSSRVASVIASMDTNWGTTATFDIGVYKKGANDDGAAVDSQLFATAVDWSGAITRVDYFKESGTLVDMDRWKPLWKLADIGAGTYTEDPGEVWTLAFTTTQDISATALATNMMVEVEYMAGD